MLKAKLMTTEVKSVHIRRVFFIQIFCERTSRNICRMNQKLKKKKQSQRGFGGDLYD